MALPTTITGSLFTQNSAHGPFHFIGTSIAAEDSHVNSVVVRFGTNQTATAPLGEQWAEPFTPSSTVTSTGVKCALRQYGSPTDNVIISIQGTSGGDPDGTDIASVTIPYTEIRPASGSSPPTYQQVRAYRWDTEVSLTGSTQYFLVFRRSGSLDNTNHYEVGSDNGLGGNDAERYRSGTWTQEPTYALWYQILDDTEKTYTLVNNSSTIEVAKSTDPETASSFSNQDTSNGPSDTAQTVWGVDEDTDFNQLGAIFMIQSYVVASGMDDLLSISYHVFDLATDTWRVTDEVVATIDATDSPDMVAADCSASLCVFTNGTIFALFNGLAETAMGSGYQRVKYSRKPTTGWSAETLIHSVPTTKEDWAGSVVVDGSGDRAHCFFKNSDLSDEYQRTWLEASTALETMPSAGDAAAASGAHAMGKGASYDDGATRRVRAPYYDSGGPLSSAKIDSGDAPGAFTTDADIGGASNVKFNNGVVAAMAADGTDLHVVWADSVDNDLMHTKNADDAGWDTPDEPFNIGAATINHVSANVYTRAGTKRLAVVVLDGSTVKYDEYDLEAAAAADYPRPHPSIYTYLRM